MDAADARGRNSGAPSRQKKLSRTVSQAYAGNSDDGEKGRTTPKGGASLFLTTLTLMRLPCGSPSFFSCPALRISSRTDA